MKFPLSGKQSFNKLMKRVRFVVRVRYLLDQFLSDGVDFGLDALLCLGRVLRVEWPVESQQVLQRALVRRDVRVF